MGLHSEPKALANQRGTSPYDHLCPGSSLYRDPGGVDSPVGSQGCGGVREGLSKVITHLWCTGTMAHLASCPGLAT